MLHGVPVRFRPEVQEARLIKSSFFIFEIMYTVYAIKSLIRNYIYVGMFSQLEKRLNRHNEGKNKTTKPYAPFELIYTETFETRLQARIREKYWKSGIGKEKLREM